MEKIGMESTQVRDRLTEVGLCLGRVGWKMDQQDSIAWYDYGAEHQRCVLT